jgi:hypothetical protein
MRAVEQQDGGEDEAVGFGFDRQQIAFQDETEGVALIEFGRDLAFPRCRRLSSSWRAKGICVSLAGL